jgi:hypothetical protein
MPPQRDWQLTRSKAMHKKDSVSLAAGNRTSVMMLAQ